MARLENNIKAKLGDSAHIHTNLDQHVLQILEDKVRLTLIDYEKQFEKAVDWWTPLSILITIVVAIITTKFEDFLFIPKDTMRAMFYMAALFFVYKTGTKIYNARKQNKITIDQVIQKLRESSEQQETESEGKEDSKGE